MRWLAQKFRSAVWDEIRYVEDKANEKLEKSTTRKYAFERNGSKKALAKGYTQVTDDFAKLHLSTISSHSDSLCVNNDDIASPLSAQQMTDQIDAMIAGMNITNERSKRDLLIKWTHIDEPMFNTDNFIPALRYTLEKYPNWNHMINTSCPRVDYSQLLSVAEEYGERIDLMISIHGLTEDERSLSVPFRRKLTLKKVIEFGKQWFDITGRKVLFLHDLSGLKNIEAEAERARELFDPEKWVPCIQFTHSIDENKAYLESRTHEALCNEADATVDAFRAELEQLGYKNTQATT